jgi:pyruvate, orthophosphate dikinase
MRKISVHFFSQKDTVKRSVDPQLLGIRGRLVNEFAQMNLPILPGFIIDATSASALSDTKVAADLAPYVAKVEAIVKKGYGDPKNPLLFKIVVSPNLTISNYPTLHNFGLTKETLPGFEKYVGDNFAVHELLFLIRGMLRIESRIAELKEDEKRLAVVSDLEKKVTKALGQEKIRSGALEIMEGFKAYLPAGFFDSPMAQLESSLKRISELLVLDEQNDDDTAIVIQPMVYGNYGKDSSSGAFFTRNIVTGEKNLQGEFFQDKFNEIGSSGKDILKIAPTYLETLKKIAGKIEDHLKEIRQIRFTIENSKLWLIEQRPVDQKSTQSDIRLFLDLNKRKIVDDVYVISRIKPGQLNEILHPVVDIRSVKKLKGAIGGITGAPGAAIGRVYFSTDTLIEAVRAAHQKGEDTRCILVMTSTFAEDVKAIEVAKGVLSSEGGYSAHASVVARQYGKVSMVRPDLKIRGNKAVMGELSFSEGDYITLNVPYYGDPQVYLGKAELIEPDPTESGLLDFIAICKKQLKGFHVRTNADNPRDAALALSFGADGVGLTRTEHMFFNEKRINVFREMIMAENKAERVKALKKLEAMQREDFYGIFKVMAGKEVTIRLLDAPLHEFLPHNNEEMAAFMAHLDSIRKTKISKAEVQARCDSISEFNPMLGHRGCRIAVTYPEIYEMQTRAMFEAIYQLQREKVDVRPEIMIPIVMNSAELKLILYGKNIEGKHYRGLVEIAEEVRKEQKGRPCHYRVGTMIELPAAALQSGDIARYAEFFSFGTNDLTQTTCGISRDDFNSFMPDYTEYDLLDSNPFSHLTPPVKELVAMAVRRGKITRPGLNTGLCGEHGAVPENVRFCMDAGLDYVSCSPYQVPISLLAVVQIEIENAQARKAAAKA